MSDIHTALEHAINEISGESDPLTRCRKAHDLMNALDQGATRLSPIRRDAVNALTGPGGTMTDTALAAHLNVSVRRIGQIRTTSTGPERGLFTDTGNDTPLTISVVEKADTERGAPAVAKSTVAAVHLLRTLTTSLNVDSEVEYVPPPGLLDLNRHLAVLMGPRVSPLVAQAITADPVISWQRTPDGHWIIIDTETGAEYRSDFDERPTTGTRCYAHIGRIRRPDGRGTFLYLGGIHAAGTAGAVTYLVTHAASLWEQVKRGQWSAVVETLTGADGTISATLASPVHLHGKR